ncbi:hypothetical protein LR090_02555 [Candidatus Bipolaricaulota bacterium]|nr:hypothetical protein [Candidatus Bipolaricaulota bacterium]
MVFIDAESGPLHTYDVLLTVIPPDSAAPGEVGTVVLSAASGGELLGEIEARIVVRESD